MLSFRQKILISYLLVLLLLLLLLFPFASHTVRTITSKALKHRAKELILKLDDSEGLPNLIQSLRNEQPQFFFRVTLLNEQGRLLYDSHAENLIGVSLKNNYQATQAEINQALEEGTGYNEEFSSLMDQKMIYVARAFSFHDQILILRLAFPFREVDELIGQFEIGFLSLASIILLLFSVMTWIIINHLSRPIQQIIQAIKPYQEGVQEVIPTIELSHASSDKDDFVKLAQTLNSLSERIQNHIDTLISERNKRETILESLGEGVIAVDAKLIVNYANTVALKLLNVIREDLIGHPLSVTKENKLHILLKECLQQGKTVTTQVLLQHVPRIYLEVLAAPLDNRNGALLVLQDKSSHFKAVEMGKDFIANASHELKTPITIIRGFAETLHDHPDLPQAMSADITMKIVRNCKRMETLVKNLLTLADIENLPKSRLQECDLYDLASNCKQLILAVYPQTEIEIHAPSEPIYLIADPHLLELAIMNLLDNGAKYSTQPAKIDLYLDQKKDKVFIKVADKGIGIPPDDLDKIFDRFYTVNKAHSRKLGGSGLGLSIVKTIIDKHMGKISVTSTLGEGTSFHVMLPAHLTAI